MAGIPGQQTLPEDLSEPAWTENMSFPTPTHALNYTLRISTRAKYVRLCLSLQRGLEVVVPKGFDTRRVAEIVRDKQRWIERTMARLCSQREVLACEETLPQRIALPALNEAWRVRYLTDRPPIEDPEGLYGGLVLAIDSDPADLGYCKQLLRTWLRQRAYTRLIPMLKGLSLAHKLPYVQASVRGQITIWASCSAGRHISINYKLLFLPPELVCYVFIHELCHTRHLDHSPRFWSLVRSLEPNYQRIEKELRTAWRLIPLWAE
jgi:predicted metal-dependent hydrolase